MDFDELRRLHRSAAGDIGDTMARRMQDIDSVTRSIREMNSAASSLREMNAASSFREMDSVARSVREMNAASNLRDVGALGLREMDPRVTGLNLREMNLLTGGRYDQARRYIELEDSVQRQLRQNLQDFGRGGITAVIRELASQAANEDWRRSVAEVAGRLSSAFALARSADFEELNRKAELLRDLTSGSPVLGMLARELASSASAGALTPALAGGFGGELLGYIEGAEAADREEAAEEFLKRFLAWLLSQAQRLPVKKLIAHALVGLLWLIVELLIERQFPSSSERNLLEEVHEAKEEARQTRQANEDSLREIREMEARLTETLVKAQAKDDDAKGYIVVKAAKLRKGPGKGFESLGVLPHNVQVEELGREGEWSHVQYFDYAEGETREGWISTALLVEKRDDEKP